MGFGLAIGMDALRACKTSPWWQGLRLRWCGAAPFPRELIAASPCDENIGSVARFGRSLTELFRGLILRGRLRVGLPDASARVRLLFVDTLPPEPAECRKYLLWLLGDAADVRRKARRVAYMALPSPLPGHRHAVVCAVSAENVIQQYERALAESRVRCSRITPSSVLLFNLFRRHLVSPSTVPVLLLALTEASSTSIMTLNGCPIFWRTRPLARSTEGPLPHGDWPQDVLNDVDEAIRYAGDTLGVDPPTQLLVAGPLAGEPGLADWMADRAGFPVTALDAGRLVKHVPRRLGAEVWNRWGVALGAAARR